jgi:hypothetical protein
VSKTIALVWNRFWAIPQIGAIVIYSVASIFRHGPKKAAVMMACLGEAVKFAGQQMRSANDEEKQ